MNQQDNRAATGRDQHGCQGSTGDNPFAAPVGTWARLPRELQQRGQWMLAGPDGKGKMKRPYTVDRVTGRAFPGKKTNPSHWMTFDAACAYAQHLGYGIGYVLSADDPFVVIDLDVKDDTPWKQIELYSRMAEGFGTYTERSVSGRGLHLWLYGNTGPGMKRDGVEVYSQQRFIVCTGDVWIDKPIAWGGEMLLNTVSQMQSSVTRQGNRILAPLLELPARKSDNDAMHRMWHHWPAKGAQFRRLWLGQNADGSSMWDARGKWIPNDYPSQSEADFALLGLLCLTIESNEQVRRLFRQSSLGQRKKAQRTQYIDDSLAVLRPFPGPGLVAYTLRPSGDALPTASIAINIDAEKHSWLERVVSTMNALG